METDPGQGPKELGTAGVRAFSFRAVSPLPQAGVGGSVRSDVRGFPGVVIT